MNAKHFMKRFFVVCLFGLVDFISKSESQPDTKKFISLSSSSSSSSSYISHSRSSMSLFYCLSISLISIRTFDSFNYSVRRRYVIVAFQLWCDLLISISSFYFRRRALYFFVFVHTRMNFL